MTGQPSQENYLDKVPQKNIDWGADDSGRIYIIKEKTRSKLLMKLINLFEKDHYFHINFDDVGTAVWKLIDGKRDLYQIGLELKKQFGKELVQVENRVSIFCAMLQRNKFITYIE